MASGNDAAVALAECGGGSEELFVEQMNQRAKAGRADTHFVNCTGLPAEGQSPVHGTSPPHEPGAHRKHPDIRRPPPSGWIPCGRHLPAGQHQQADPVLRRGHGSENRLHRQRQYCLSATAEREGMELIAVVLKSPTGQQRFEDAKALLNYGFSTYAPAAHGAGGTFPRHPGGAGETETVQPCIGPEAVALVQKSQAGGLSQSVTLAEQVEAPVSTGQELGTLTLTDAAGETVQSIPIRAAQAWSVLPSVPCCAGCCRRQFFAG